MWRVKRELLFRGAKTPMLTVCSRNWSSESCQELIEIVSLSKIQLVPRKLDFRLDDKCQLATYQYVLDMCSLIGLRTLAAFFAICYLTFAKFSVI